MPKIVINLTETADHKYAVGVEQHDINLDAVQLVNQLLFIADCITQFIDNKSKEHGKKANLHLSESQPELSKTENASFSNYPESDTISEANNGQI